MFRLRLVIALALAFQLPASVFAMELVDINFNSTLPANSSCVTYSDGWTQQGEDLVYDKLAHTDQSIPAVTINATCEAICLYGHFDTFVEIEVMGVAGSMSRQNYTSTDDQTVVCVKTVFSYNGFLGLQGIRSLRTMTLTSRMKGPSGTTTDDIVLSNQAFVQDGKVSEELDTSFSSAPAVVQDGVHFNGQMNLTLPENTTYFVIRGPTDPSFADFGIQVGPKWPEPLPLGDAQWFIRPIAPHSAAPGDTPVLFSGACDPTIQYTIIIETNPTVGDGYTLSSMDLYSIKPKFTTSTAKPKSIAGPVAGGVIGGICLLLLLGLAWWYLGRVRERKSYGAEEAKFQIDTEYLVAMPFTESMSPTETETASAYRPTGGKSLAHGAAVDNAAAVRNLICESDGGGLIQGNDKYLPPSYNPAWGAPSSSSASSSGPSGSEILSPTTESTLLTYPTEKRRLPDIPQ